MFEKEELQNFISNLKEIIENLNDLKDKSELIILINKLHLSVENFFLNSEIAVKNNSEFLHKIKDDSKNFFNELNKIEKDLFEEKSVSLMNLVNFLTKWIEKNKIS